MKNHAQKNVTNVGLLHFNRKCKLTIWKLQQRVRFYSLEFWKSASIFFRLEICRLEICRYQVLNNFCQMIKVS